MSNDPNAGTTKPTIASLRASVGVSQSIYVQGYYSPGDGGGGQFSYVSSDTTSADNAGTIIVDANGHRYYRQTNEDILNVMWFGAKGDGTTDDTSAINAAYAVGSSVYFPGLDFKITSAIDLTAIYGAQIHGAGMNAGPAFTTGATRIIQFSSNTPIFKIWGPVIAENAYLGYSTQQSLSNTESLALACNNVENGAVFRNLRIYYAHIGVGIPQIGFAATGYNTMFDTEFDNVQMYLTSHTPYDLRGFNGGCTNVIINLPYINGGGSLDFSTPGQSMEYGFRATNWSGFQIGGCSIDGVIVNQAILECTAGANYFTIDTFRMEAVTYKKNLSGWVVANGSDFSAIINYIEWNNCRCLIADAATSNYLFFINTTKALLTVMAIRVTANCNFTSPVERILYTNASDAESQYLLWDINNLASGLSSTAWTDNQSLSFPLIRIWNGQEVTSIHKSGVGTTTFRSMNGSAAPVSGTWAVGDRVVKALPVIAGAAMSQYMIIGWVCTTGGAPGTWSESRVLTGT